MDDLIIIILTLIIAGVGALGQLKKKKQVSGAEQQTGEPENFWDLIQGGASESQPLSELDFEQPEIERREMESVEEPEVLEKKPTARVDEGEATGLDINKVSSRTKKKKLRSILNEDFSLRKAVVYSEILNRKYN